MLLADAALAVAEPAEPLTITRLGDSESQLLVFAGAAETRSPDSAAEGFSHAVTDALRTQQQSIEASCRGAPRGLGPIAAQWAWEARCRYRRY